MSVETHLVIGASSGIGRALAAQLLAEGCRVIGLARRVEKVRELGGGDRLLALACDVSDREQVRACAARIREEGWLPDYVHLNAGLHEYDLMSEADRASDAPSFMLKYHKAAFDANYFGLLSWVEELLPDFIARGRGVFVGTSSVMAFRGFASPSPSYGASKAAMTNFMEAMHGWYSHSGLRFVVVHPGPVATRMLRSDKPIRGTWSPERAARYTLRKVRAGALEIHYPWHWLLVFRSFRYLPPRLFQLVNLRWWYRGAKKRHENAGK